MNETIKKIAQWIWYRLATDEEKYILRRINSELREEKNLRDRQLRDIELKYKEL